MKNIFKKLFKSSKKSTLRVKKAKVIPYQHICVVCKKGVPRVYLNGKLFDGSYSLWKRVNLNSIDIKSEAKK